MRNGHNKEYGTRDRLLDAACVVFAQKGYSDATIAEICERAAANIAAVNYHFGSKEALYVESWRVAFERSLEANPPDGGVSASAPPAERLRGRILSIMRRLGGPKAYEFEIIHKELANPTGLLVEAMRRSIEPVRRQLLALVQLLLGPEVPVRQAELCMFSIRSQCFDLMVHQRRCKLFAKAGMEAIPFHLDFDIETLAEHITCFSLAGIREIRRQVQAGETNEEESS